MSSGTNSSLISSTRSALGKHTPASRQPGGSAQSASAMRQAADEDWSDDTFARAASRARVGSSKSAAQMLAGSVPVPPGPDATAAASRLFVTDADPAELDRLAAAVEKARSLPANRRPRMLPKQAAMMGRSLHAPAAPGPWGFRNSYICAMLAHPRGPRTLANWSSWWASGDPRKEVACVWEPSLMHPFYKADGSELRPVVCSESLLKFAGGCTFSSFRAHVALACGRRQYGARRADGAALMVSEVRAASRLHPRRVIAEGDAANAFGSVSRAEGLEIVIAKTPELAPLLAAMWQVASLTLLLNDGAGGWAHIHAFFGVLQGGHSGQPVYCLIFKAVEEDFFITLGDEHPSIQVPDPWKYVDDGIL